MNAHFNFTDFPVLATGRFILRKAQESDCFDLLELYSNESVVKYIPLEPFNSVEDSKNEMNWYEKIYEDKSGLRWLIEEPTTKKVIGTCGFLNYEKAHNRIEIGYDLIPSYWGKGIMKETLSSIIHFAFTKMNMNKIEAKVDEHEFEKGKYVDLINFSILKRDYL
ncbi:N-acetyltransferase [Lysinibacillus sp. KCTC 33748]|uniref:GNAT family N-acetyltransferase n=1 Tax=unclassified Lysinibacillus TaxID=2636778 RepID=UPI0009A86FCF|nr:MULTISPECIES: GNAT family N-acetyltransferase [unclassified Lysinibacillus]OXS74854.1 N-acetyltransferase [Lysinibacillus sp. KCTC 33748]